MTACDFFYDCVYTALALTVCMYRFQKRYMLLGGIWFSKSKPPMNMFLRPLLDDIAKLQSTGTVYNY